MNQPIVRIRDLRVEARTATMTIVAVDRLDLDVYRGDVVGLIGESGSGKTTTVRALMGLLARNVHVTRGSIEFDGRVVFGDGVDEVSSIRGRKAGMVFQSASQSLNPLLRIGSQMREVLKANRPELPKSDRQRRCFESLSRMGFTDPLRVLRSYPHQLSGGMQQRVAISIATICEPQLVVADECTSALDVTTQAEVVGLLREIAATGTSGLIFVTHDLQLAAELCSRLVVMYGGEVVEEGPTGAVVASPQHPYTRALLDSVPKWGPREVLAGIDGAPPKVTPGLVGCHFAPRCRRAWEDCVAHDVPWFPTDEERGNRCLLSSPQFATRATPLP